MAIRSDTEGWHSPTAVAHGHICTADPDSTPFCAPREQPAGPTRNASLPCRGYELGERILQATSHAWYDYLHQGEEI